MLVISRKIGEKIKIGEDITLVLIDIVTHRGQARIGIDAPKEVLILRGEVEDRNKKEVK